MVFPCILLRDDEGLAHRTKKRKAAMHWLISWTRLKIISGVCRFGLIARAAVVISGVWMAQDILARAQPEPLDFWEWRYPLPQGEDLAAVAFGGGKFVAV